MCYLIYETRWIINDSTKENTLHSSVPPNIHKQEKEYIRRCVGKKIKLLIQWITSLLFSGWCFQITHLEDKKGLFFPGTEQVHYLRRAYSASFCKKKIKPTALPTIYRLTDKTTKQLMNSCSSYQHISLWKLTFPSSGTVFANMENHTQKVRSLTHACFVSGCWSS